MIGSKSCIQKHSRVESWCFQEIKGGGIEVRSSSDLDDDIHIEGENSAPP